MELTTLDQVENRLSNYYKTAVSSINETDANKTLAKTLMLQLEVISAIKAPRLYNSAVTMMIETLSVAKKETSDEMAIWQMQRQVAYMINSMVFFLEAYMYYEEDRLSAKEDKLSEEGKRLLIKACNKLVDGINNIIQMRLGLLGVGKNKDEDVISANALSEDVEKGLIEGIIDYFHEKNKLRNERFKLSNMRDNYYSFLDSTIRKLSRNHYLFGKSSIVISELIHDKKDELIEYKLRGIRVWEPSPPFLKYSRSYFFGFFNFEKDSEYLAYIKKSLYLAAVPFGLIVLLFIVLGGIKLINLTPLDLDSWESGMLTVIRYCGYAEAACVALVLLVVIVPWIIYCFEIIIYAIACWRTARMRQRTIKFYEKVASQFEGEKCV